MKHYDIICEQNYAENVNCKRAEKNLLSSKIMFNVLFVFFFYFYFYYNMKNKSITTTL